MKEYGRHVIWLDYFNSELKRTQGRRVPLSSATRSPSLVELEEACRRLSLQPVHQEAFYPGSSSKPSGYVTVAKVGGKQALVMKVARELGVVRGLAQKRQPQPGQGRKKQ
jgi:signal recognition particle subunit SRP19